MTDPEPPATRDDDPAAGSPAAGKGRPTPKRSERTKRRTGPVPPPPQTRKEAAQRLRAQSAQERSSRRSGYVAGDEKAMLPRDAGPVRRLVRDVVDSRRNFAVLLLPLALLSVGAELLGDERIQSAVGSVWVAGLLATIVDLVLLGLRVRSRVRDRFPDEQRLRGHVFYALLRSTTFRKLRMPPPRVAVGEPV